MSPFRMHHLIAIMSEYEKNSFPLDNVLRFYFRSNKAIGSKDRKEICFIIYGMMRWRSLLDYLLPSPTNWSERAKLFQEFDPKEYFQKENIPIYKRVSFPKAYFELLQNSHGLEKTKEICLHSNEEAPTTIRVNAIKTTRDQMLQKWHDLYPLTVCKQSSQGLTFQKKYNFFAMQEFKDGLFEVQDEGSQLLAELLEVSPKEHVLDYCSGSGGKTLAFAHKMQGKGQIYLHDIRPKALFEAKKRLKRAGIQNAQLVTSDKLKKKGYSEKMDWILLDVPCSGSGTLRRNPDMKWKFAQDNLDTLVTEQRDIFAKAMPLLKSGGKIVYSTCSLFKEENRDQVEYFLQTHPVTLIKEPLQTFPTPNQMDGFFGAVFEKNI